MKVLMIAEHREGQLKKATLDLIAHTVNQGRETHVALLGDSLDPLLKELSVSGAKTIHTLQSALFRVYTGEAYTEALISLVQQLKPQVILANHTPMGKDCMPRLAARLKTGLASDCVSLAYSEQGVQARRPVYSGKASVEVEFLGSGPQLVTLRPNALGPRPVLSSPSQAEVIPFSFSLPPQKTKVLEVIQGNTGRPDVTEAAIVVSGGRSLKNAENFKLLEELADTIGAAVGASRAAVDAGYRPHRDQVGQTGKVVSPSLYCAFGISGAIQHLAGMRSSKVIVAVNTDPDAPIFQVADYGIVGDLFTLAPLIREELKKLREHD